MINDMTPREKRKQRKQWNLHQCNHRQQLKTYASLLTPPGSPDSEHQPTQNSNTNKVRGRKQIRRDRAKAYRKIEHLTVKLQQAQKSTKRVQKRYERAVKKMNDIDTGTPNSKSKRILDYGNRKKIQKCLTFSFSLAKSIRERYQTLRTQREKKLVRTVFCNSYLKKYRLIKYSSTLLGVPLNTLKSPQFQRKCRRDRHSDHTIKAIQDFFLRDDNSSMRPGKKDTITHAKEKIQKRLLCDTMLNLHHKFVYENPKLKVSYVFFCRQKPFWVVRPTIADRDTCKCRTHENIQLMADRLYSLKMITERDPEKLLSSICCSVKCCECMYRECAECKDSRLKYEKYNPTETTWWYEWRVVDHDYKNHTTGKIETTKKTVKVRAEGPLDHLADIFQESLGRKLGRHVFNIRHQFEQLHQKKLSLGNNEMMFHIDFSENYSLKYHSEIQSVHFGASNAQVTLHTGMLYTKSNSMAFASVSDCRRHDASAIWAHMKPMFYIFPKNIQKLTLFILYQMDQQHNIGVKRISTCYQLCPLNGI
ncbi:hypothetical protein SNE40_015131 [Patella caerulea]|uniref:Uncharacterized protein n=1 Tax=Patella caerulea TaxID=87958 RepID=A0AAN8JGF1_PATCE